MRFGLEISVTKLDFPILICAVIIYLACFYGIRVIIASYKSIKVIHVFMVIIQIIRL